MPSQNYSKIQNRYNEIPKNIKSDTEVSFYYLSYLIDKYKDADDAIKVFQKTIRGNFAFVIFIKKNRGKFVSVYEHIP